MKPPQNISRPRRRGGMMLLECMVYISVFAILVGGGFTVFYFCWSHTQALIGAAGDIESALHAGERWRADVRGATGKISSETTAAGEVVRMPAGEKEIIYRFEAGEVRREFSSPKNSQLVLPKVSASAMQMETRGGVVAWRWELELAASRKETHLPLRFTFEAAQTKP